MGDHVSDIKARLGVYDVISAYVPLKKAGVNYKGPCPFHNEKTPSFVVSPEKQIFHCFGCHKGGDIFTFIQEIEGVEFPEALQILADKAGVKIDDISKISHKAGKSEKDEYYKAHDLASDFFEKQLFSTNDGKKVLEYLHKRGLKDETIKEFRIGFAPDSYEMLYPYLVKKGISKNVLLKSGFVSAKGLADDRIYDKFRSRLMFPVFDYMGRICGFGGRALKQDQAPKYLNSPENVIYSKSKILYGFSHAKEAIKSAGNVVITEGYFDMIVPYQSGIKNIVASCGTALTTEQVAMIKRLNVDIISCFDKDNAGFEATKRAYGLVQKDGVNMRVVKNFAEKDPADFILQNSGDAFFKIISEAQDFMSFLIDTLMTEQKYTDAISRQKVLKELLPFLKNMPLSSKDVYVKQISAKFDCDSALIYDEIEQFKLPKDHPANLSDKRANDIPEKAFLPIAEIILAILLKFPGFFKNLGATLHENDFDEEFKAIYKALTDQYNQFRDELSEWDFDKGILAENKEKVDVLTIYAEDLYDGFSEEAIMVELQKLVDKMCKDRKVKRLREIQIQISAAENSGEKEKLLNLLQLQKDLLN